LLPVLWFGVTVEEGVPVPVLVPLPLPFPSLAVSVPIASPDVSVAEDGIVVSDVGSPVAVVDGKGSRETMVVVGRTIVVRGWILVSVCIVTSWACERRANMKRQ